MCANERLAGKTIQAFKPAAPGRSCRGGHETPGYRARAPGSPLSRIVLGNLQEFERWLKNPPDPRPPRPQPAVISTLEKFIECGVMRYGAVRFRCPGCGDDIFVALSCKRRGCPFCDAKRSAIITGQALERLLAFVPYRQWVLVVPKRLRYFLNRNPALAGELSRIFAGEINRFLCQTTAGTPAQLHFIQRFGGALNLHIHVYAVVSDGVFSLKANAIGRKEVVFTPVPCPADQQLAAIVTAVRKKLIRRVRKISGLSQEAADNLDRQKMSDQDFRAVIRAYDATKPFGRAFPK